MYHFTFIEETSLETEAKRSGTQENERIETLTESTKSQSLLKKTAYFLHKYLDQPNCVRIYISKN
jgi:hypothetical protein